MTNRWWKYEPRPMSRLRFASAAGFALFSAFQFAAAHYFLAIGMAAVSGLHLWYGFEDRRGERTALADPGPQAERSK